MAVVMKGKLADLGSWEPSGCSIARALEIIGTRSAILILREAYYGTQRFDGFVARIGITDAAAAKQLRKLTDAGLLEKRPYRENGQRTRYEYVLTQKGLDLLPAVVAIWQWGDKYLQAGAAPLVRFDTRTGEPVQAELHAADGAEVDIEHLGIRLNDE